MKNFLSVAILASILLISCDPSDPLLFTKINSENSNLNFTNRVFQTHSRNQAHNYYFYNGAGVTICDFNNDGLEDVFLVGNHVSSRLYLNKGQLVFQDISEQAGILNDYWTSGATFVDLNADGFQDIFINTVGKNEPNLLYINKGVDKNGVPTFEEKSFEYGLDDTIISTQAAFLDYDRDNDLDLFIAVNSQRMDNRDIPKNRNQTSYTRDKFYRNNGDNTFTDISEEAGIVNEGYSLGIAINDLNNDGWADIYVANDFISNDLIYINNGHGAFDEKGISYLRHASKNGMGVDIADINQDGLMDITVLDMLPKSNRRRKLMLSPVNYDLYEYRNELGYIPQHIRNTLQINNGRDHAGNYQFSEVGCLAGMYATDWSWSPLWADFDNDGGLDLFVTNGYHKDLTDLDWALGLGKTMTSGSEKYSVNPKMELLSELRPIKANNVFYKNTGNLVLKDASVKSGLSEPSFSHGSAFADLDNDGDLDLIVNNLEHETFLYRNNTIEDQKPEHCNSYLQIDLNDPGKNTNGVGTRLTLTSNGKSQTYYHSNVRGYLSSMSNTIHFGFGNVDIIESLTIYWPDGAFQAIKNIAVNQKITIAYQPTEKPPDPMPETKHVVEVADSIRLDYEHVENKYTDFKSDPLFLKMYSREGPSLAVGDVNGDGEDDLLVGGASGQSATLFVQRQGQFDRRNILIEDTIYEDMGMLLFDIDNDGDQDLYAVSGGTEKAYQSELYEDRLYKNDGSNFIRSDDLPSGLTSGGTVRGADFDKDGDIDLFVGGKIAPGRYPQSPKSYLLENKDGILTDNTPITLKEIGMISDALWTDFNGDDWPDLVAVGEWTEIMFFVNKKGKLEAYTDKTGLLNTTGWWNSITSGDYDNDGDMDYMVGNFGINSFITASAEMPVRLYAADFDGNGKIDPILSYYTEDDEGHKKEFPIHPRDALVNQVVSYKKQFTDYKSFANADFNEVLKAENRNDANVLKAETLTSGFVENLGNGKFKITPLPLECQVSPVFGMLTLDTNGDGNLDVIVTGNLNSSEPLFGNHDASNGVYMMGNGKGDFTPIPAHKSGLFLNGDQKSVVSLFVNNNSTLVAGANSGKLKAYNFNPNFSITPKVISLAPLDVYAEITFKDDRKCKREFYYGNTFLSQTSRKLELRDNMKEVWIYNADGNSRKVR